MGRNKGSLTIEAVISFTIFLSFMFMLLSVVKFAITDITLSCATSETAKQLAAVAYPVQMINDAENETDEVAGKYSNNSGAVTLAKGLDQTIQSTVINMIFATSSKERGKAVSGGFDSLASMFMNQAAANIWNYFRDNIAEIKDKAKYAVAANIFNSCIENSLVNIDKDKITLEVVELPQSNYEWNHSQLDKKYLDMGLKPGTNFGQEDVVIGIKYDYKILLPFFPAMDITIREIAIEHAWIHGGDGTITAKKEGIDVTKIADFLLGGDNVYIGLEGHGKCFHKNSCFTIKDHCKEISRWDAYNRGLRPCKFCHPNEDE